MQNAIKIILEASIYSSIMIFIVLSIKSLFSGKLNIKIMSFLWIAVLVRLMLPATLESPVHIADINPFSRVITSTSSADEATNTKILENESTENIIPINMSLSETENTAPAIGKPKVSIYQKIKNLALKSDIWAIVFYIWASGAIFVFAKKSYTILSFKKKLLATEKLNSKLTRKLKNTKKIINIKTDVKIAESRYADIPLVYGLVSPTILLPIGFAQSINDNKLALIILHELCHVKRRDILANYFWLIAKTLHWFNPLVHIAYKSHMESIEEACDEMVLRYQCNKNKLEYTQSLLDVIRLSKNKCLLPLSVSFCNNTSSIKKRVIKMIKPQKKSKTMLLATVLITCVMVFTCFTTACQTATASESDTSLSEENVNTNPTPIETPIATPTSDNNNLVEPDPTPEEDELITAIRKLELSEIHTIRLSKVEDYFGDTLAYYNCNDGAEGASYRMLKSDKSLVAFENKAVDMTLSIQLSDDEFLAIATDYAKKVWGYENVEITSFEASTLGPEGDFYHCGVDGVIRETGRTFSITLNGQGELRGAGSYPTDVDIEKGISIDKAKQIALELLREQAHIADESNLTLISETLSTDYSPMYIFSYEYRSDNPTAKEYDYDCEVKVIAATGKTMGAGITPITSNINVYTIEEAEQMAKEYIVSETGLDDISKLVTTEKWSSTDEKDGIIYTFMFKYNSKYAYSLMMTATGDFWDIASGLID